MDINALHGFLNKTVIALKKAEEAGDMEEMDRLSSYLDRAKPVVERAKGEISNQQAAQQPPAAPQEPLAIPKDDKAMASAPQGTPAAPMAPAFALTRTPAPPPRPGAFTPDEQAQSDAYYNNWGNMPKQQGIPSQGVSALTPAELQMPSLPPIGTDLTSLPPGTSFPNNKLEWQTQKPKMINTPKGPMAAPPGGYQNVPPPPLAPPMFESERSLLPGAKDGSEMTRIPSPKENEALKRQDIHLQANKTNAGKAPFKGAPAHAVPKDELAVPNAKGGGNEVMGKAQMGETEMLGGVLSSASAVVKDKEEADEIAKIKAEIGEKPESLSLENLMIMLLMGAPRAFSKIIADNKDYRDAFRSAMAESRQTKARGARQVKEDAFREREVKAKEDGVKSLDSYRKQSLAGKPTAEDEKMARTILSNPMSSADDLKWARSVRDRAELTPPTNGETE